MSLRIANACLIIFGIPLNAQSQLTDVEDYRIFASSINNIKEWRVDYDTVGQATDTVLDYEFLFNKEHQLIEERWNFSKDFTSYASYKYQYPEQGVKIQVYDSPLMIIDGAFTGYPKSKCESYNMDGELDTTRIVYKNRIETWTFQYDVDSGLLTDKFIYIDGVLSTKYFIEYNKWK